MMARSLFSRTGNGNHVVDTHDQVGNDNGLNRTPKPLTRMNLMLSFIGRGNELDADPQQQQAAAELQERYVHHGDCEGNQNDTQQNSTAGTIDNAFHAQVRIETSASQRNHNGIVSAKQNVDENDLQNCDPMNLTKPSNKRFQNELLLFRREHGLQQRANFRGIPCRSNTAGFHHG